MPSKAKYLTIKEELISEINVGKYAPGQKFYSEADLKIKYEVSSATVIKAIHELVNEGYLFRQQGKGTFVSKAKRNKPVLISESDSKIKLNSSQVSLISVTLEAMPAINTILKQPEDQCYYKIIRLKSEKDIPYTVQTSYIPEQYLNPQKILDESGYLSLYDHLADVNNIDMYAMPFAEEVIVINCDRDDIAHNLSIPPSTAVVKINRTTHSQSGDVIEYIETYKRIESFYLKFESVRGG